MTPKEKAVREFMQSIWNEIRVTSDRFKTDVFVYRNWVFQEFWTGKTQEEAFEDLHNFVSMFYWIILE